MQQRYVITANLLCAGASVIPLGREVKAAQYDTSAANGWIQLESDDSFTGRNGKIPLKPATKLSGLFSTLTQRGVRSIVIGSIQFCSVFEFCVWLIRLDCRRFHRC